MIPVVPPVVAVVPLAKLLPVVLGAVLGAVLRPVVPVVLGSAAPAEGISSIRNEQWRLHSSCPGLQVPEESLKRAKGGHMSA